jgi:Histone deacetylase domain
MVPGRPGIPGSHGFCLLNNVAIGAAYALSTHRHAGIRRVALLDFDVHHGNGTEERVFHTVPHETARAIDTPYSDGVERFQHWRPWFDGDDRRCILFASVQGYGPRSGRGGSDFIYPGSGETADNAAAAQLAVRAARRACMPHMHATHVLTPPRCACRRQTRGMRTARRTCACTRRKLRRCLRCWRTRRGSSRR